MDVLPRITRQLIELLREMSPVQRVTVIAIPVALLLGFSWLVFLNSGSDFRELSFGKAFASDEMASAEQALVAAGLTGFRREGQRLLAPGNELDRYNAALLQSDALPADLGTQMLKQYETLGPFSTDRQRQQMKEALLLQELRRMIKAVPEIQDAHVVIASSERRGGWNQKPRTSANVMVKPRKGREISAMLVNSLRHVVASMVADLNPIDVTIFDVSRGQAFTGETANDPADGRFLQHAQALTRQYEQQIHRALSYIPNVSVTAHVDFDALKSAMIHSDTIRSRRDGLSASLRESEFDGTDEHQTGFRGATSLSSESTREDKKLVAAMPRSVQVSVSIPRDYIREVVASQIAKGAKPTELIDQSFVEEEVLSKVEQIVGRLIPADSPSDAVSVICVDRLDGEVAEVDSLSRKEQLAILAYKWGSSVAVGVLVLIVFYLMRSSGPAIAESREEVSRHATDEVQTAFPRRNTSPIVNPPDRVEVLRDEIRSMVESDATGSAVLVGQWLSTTETTTVNGERKTAILLLSLDQGLAAQVLGKLPRDQVERITLAIAGVENVKREEQESILDEFKTMFDSRPLMHAAGPDTARELLERTLDRNEVEPLTQRFEDQIQAGPFAFLHNRHPDDIRRLIEDEHPQTISMISAQLPPNLRGAQVLAGFSAPNRRRTFWAALLEWDQRIPNYWSKSRHCCTNVWATCRFARAAWPSCAADVLREAPRATSRSVLQSLETKDANLAVTLRTSMFAFNDLGTLDAAVLQLVLRKTDHFCVGRGA